MSIFTSIRTALALAGTLLVMAATAAPPAGPGQVVRGTVTTSDGRPAASVTVHIKGTKRSTLTGEDGRFTLRNLQPGTYTLEISLVGYETTAQEVTVGDTEPPAVQLHLSISQKQLEGVVVVGGRTRFRVDSSNYVAKMPLKDLENPQVVETVPRALMEEQQLTNFNDALRNVPGMPALFSNQAFGQATFASRGFATSADLRNGVAAAGTSDLDPANIEEIEVLKGPSGTLFGSTLVSWGGLINIVTKQPYDHFGGNVSYTGGSYRSDRFTADINTPLNQDKTVLFRMNAAYTESGSWQDAGFTKSTFLAPVIEYKPNDQLSVTLEADFYGREGTTPFTLYAFDPIAASSPKGLPLSYNESFTNNQIVTHSPTTNIFGQIKYKLSDHWTSQTVASITRGLEEGPYQWNSFSSPSGDSLVRTITDWNETITNKELQQNFIGDYTWGKLRNRLVAGIDYYAYYETGVDYYLPFDTLSLASPGSEYLNLTPSAISAREATGQYGPSPDNNKEYTYAAYASDVFNLTDYLVINAALRVDHINEKGSFDPTTETTSGAYNQTALSPKFGIVFQPVKNKVSLFANYSNGFQNNTGVNFNGQPFKPSYGNQWEEGVKLDVWKHRLSATVSYYDIYASDLLETDSLHPNFSIQDGVQRSKGIEASVTVAPFAGFNIIAGYSHNDSKNIKDYDYFEGTRPNNAGPVNTANLYASYHLLTGAAKGLGFGFGGNYASDQVIVQGFALPSYTILNASVFYDRPSFRIGFKMDNLTNRKYWTGWNDLSPQMPVNASVNVSFKF